MGIAWGRIVPVLVSIAIIIAILRSYSRTVAAITATMPVTIPLSLWIIYAAEGGEQTAVARYAEVMLMGPNMLGIVPTVVFVFVVWWTARLGWGLLPMIAAGYGGWAVTLGMPNTLGIVLLRRLVGG